MNSNFRRNPNDPLTGEVQRQLKETEWLVTNGLGGYASGTVSGALTRVFHGYLIAALPTPHGRTMILNDLIEHLVLPDGTRVRLTSQPTAEGEDVEGTQYLTGFRLEKGLPVWTYEINNLTLEKRLVVPHRQNTVYVTYQVVYGTGSVHLEVRPAVNMRGHEAPVSTPVTPYSLEVRESRYELKKSGQDLPPLRMTWQGNEAIFAIDFQTTKDLIYDVEKSRGYSYRGDLWSPGYFSVEVSPRDEATFVASVESWDVALALSPQQAWDAEGERKRRLLLEAHPAICTEECRDLIWAADQFVFVPVGRREDTARARAAGDEIRSVIAGYHWFTDWGRDTMISLEGLTLSTGREVEASYILRTFAHYIKDGLIPNMFPEGKSDGLYHTADATLWFFHALERYMQRTNDEHLLAQLLPRLLDIVGHHLRGTHFNIHVDPSDGLLVEGQEDYQLTWMDAKVDGWVVTPRWGKAVEINALWYNALCLLENWLRQAKRTQEADGIAEHAQRCRKSFNKRFWYEKGGYLYDVVDQPNGEGNDAKCRPNQIFSISLDYPILEESRWEAVLKVVQQRLLTPVGLRSLAPGEPDYKPYYDGDLRSRDAAYHEGTVWAWLIGPFIDAWLKVYPKDVETAEGFLYGFQDHLNSACVGSISEIFDAEPPFKPRGCCAQAWSVAEVLRCHVNTRGIVKGSKPIPSLVGAGVE
ncbi:MAG: putative glycogen debranching enzyme [Bryobacterales bacterium]|nr:putative glycogen debranching enzyme [Bryobacterales bacterium]